MSKSETYFIFKVIIYFLDLPFGEPSQCVSGRVSTWAVAGHGFELSSDLLSISMSRLIIIFLGVCDAKIVNGLASELHQMKPGEGLAQTINAKWSSLNKVSPNGVRQMKFLQMKFAIKSFIEKKRSLVEKKEDLENVQTCSHMAKVKRPYL